MPSLDITLETPISRSSRARQLEAMFDVPADELSRVPIKAEIPIEQRSDWRVGLIVGPSGSGKTTIARRMFGDAVATAHSWKAASVIDDFDSRLSIQTITQTCSAVGFNTIPAWLRPFAVLSNGEQFRAELARNLAEASLSDVSASLVVVDEFTSVVDRQVAKIVAHAVAKHVRKQTSAMRFVGVSCHYDVIDWLQPNWVYDCGASRFDWRSLRRRPDVMCVVGRVPYAAWRMFAPFHYLTRNLHRAARCFGLWVIDEHERATLTTFAGVLCRPISTRNRRSIWGISRVVTLPDWQGLGLAFVLMDSLGAAYTQRRCRFRMYPAHPSFVLSFDRSPKWAMIRPLGSYSSPSVSQISGAESIGGRPCAVFEYVGPSATQDEADRLFTEL